MTRIRLLKALAIGAFLLLALHAYSAFSHVGKLFAGFLPRYRLTLVNFEKGFEVYDRIRAVDGRALSSNADLERYLAALFRPEGSKNSCSSRRWGSRASRA